jgi:S-DNA-T family DNA segregation ATPase FtsK/SpoIIIE
MKISDFKIVDTQTFRFDKVPVGSAESLLASAEGILGLEWYYTKDKEKLYLFTQAMSIEQMKLALAPKLFISLEDRAEVSCFSIGQYRSSCFPFKMDLNENVFDSCKKYLGKSLQDEQIVVQVLLRKKKPEEWVPQLKQMYNDYLNGIELPTSIEKIRSIQYRILEFLRTKDEWLGRNPGIVNADQKFIQQGFEVCIRFAIYGGTKEKRNQIASKMKLGLSSLNYANSFIMNYCINRRAFLNNLSFRKFPLMGSSMIMCVSELLPFFSAYETVPMTPENIIENVITTASTEAPKNKGGAFSDVIELFPRGEKLVREFDTNKFEAKLNRAFKKLRMLEDGRLIKIKSVHEGATLKKISFKLPEGLTLSTLSSKKSIQNIETEMALQNIAMEQGVEAGTVNLVIPQDEREMVLIRDCMENTDFQNHVKEKVLPFVLGLDSMGNPVYECLDRIKHMLIVGMTGSGKSVLINSILTMLLLLRSPKQMQMLLLDPKQVELAIYAKYPHVIDVLTDKEESYTALLEMVNKMEERYAILAKKGCKNLEQYNSKVPESERLPHIVVVIEELADYMLTFSEFDRPIEILAGKARAAGIHLIICTQKPLSNIVTSLVKGNIISRVCLLCDGWRSYNVALDESVPFELLGKGDGVYRFEGITGLHRFQSARIGRNDNEDESIIEQLADYWKGNFKKETLNIDTSALKSVEVNKLKKIIASSGETRVTKLREMMGIKAEKLQELMAQLVEEKWLSPPPSRSKGYGLLISEEQRKAFLESLN